MAAPVATPCAPPPVANVDGSTPGWCEASLRGLPLCARLSPAKVSAWVSMLLGTQDRVAKAVAKTGAKAKVAEKIAEPKMPKLAKTGPAHYGSCTIYADVKKKQWRAIEKSNRRRDVKFSWKTGPETKASWEACVKWCRDNTK